MPEFDHNKTKYPLRGMHESVQCVQCHKQPVFTNVGKNCADCHDDVHRRQLGSDCAQCHTVKGWNIAVQAVRDHQNRFPLLGAHAAVQCDECHKQAATGMFLGLSTSCDSCHLKDWQKTTNPPHPSAGPAFASSNCQNCHQQFDSWLNAKFDHSTTGFPLTAGHANVACTACHINNNYNLQIQPNDCGNSGCHLTTWQQTNNPPHPSAGPTFAAANCSGCHNTTSWLTATFDHSTTGFPLTAGHANVPCASCHVNNNYNLKIQPTDCGNAGCHLTTWQQTNNPIHSQAGPAFAASNCSTCHNTSGWTNVIFDHSTTGFQLTNGHANVACTACHINNNYNLQIQPTDCGNSGCHLTTWQQTNNPTHSSAGAPFAAANCSTCHNTISWNQSIFDHSATGWPLVGSHQLAPAGKVNQCTDCHTNNNYNFTSANTDCYGCHQTAWNSTKGATGAIPDHIAAGFPTSLCSTCHDTILWSDGKFNHTSTGFPLTNAHATVACGSCHTNGNFNLQIQPTDCGNSGCHLTTWQQTNNPTHSAAGAPFAAANCNTCHDTIAWSDVTFNHASTGWPLTGSHQFTPAGKVSQCTDCHVGNNYNFTSANTDCYGCHQTAWNSTKGATGAIPDHIAAGFPTSLCSTCHDTVLWSDGKFNHTSTGFPLTNAHATVACGSCHVNSNYNLQIQPTDCGNSGCHLTTWQQTNNPTHSAAGTPFAVANCNTCHDTIAWTDVTFNHASTGWPLTGSHQFVPAGKVVQCTDCHVGNNYNFTSANTDCYGCHQTAWNSTKGATGSIPDHIAAGFPTSLCSTCHDTIAWPDGKFDHSTTGWALTGAHLTKAKCSDCHIGGNYSLTAANTACYGCHMADWNSTQTLGGSVPNHVAAGFPTTCDTAGCHNTTSWLGATFNHTYFPIPHHGSVCNDCHQVQSDFSSFTCINCHTQTAHQQTQTNQIHMDIGGYSYGPETCYNCHKNGGGG